MRVSRLGGAIACAAASLGAAGCLGTGTKRLDASCREMSALVVREMRFDTPSLPIVDVRRPSETTQEEGRIEGALVVPLDELATRLPRLAALKETTLVVLASEPSSGRLACEALAAAGFRYVIFVSDGAAGWFRANPKPRTSARTP